METGLEGLERRVMFSTNASFSHRTFQVPAAESADVVDVLGDTAVFAGGYVQDPTTGRKSGPVNDVYFFNAAKKEWSAGKMPSAIQGMSETVVGEQMVFAGGWDSDGVTAAVSIYTARRHRWSTAKLSEPRAEVAAVTVGDTALFAGGMLNSGRSSSTIDLYNGHTGRWSTAALPVPRRGIAAVTVGRLALFAGGARVGAHSSDEVDIYDSKTGRWSTAHLSAAGYCFATAVGHYALFEHLRASNLENGPAEVDVYDANDSSWSTLEVPDILYDVQTVGKFAVFADGLQPGNGDLGATSPTVRLFNSETARWTTAQLPAALSNIGISGVDGRYVLFAGGATEQRTETDKVYVLDAETGKWDTTAKLSVPREAIDTFTIGKTSYFAGGRLDIFANNISNVMDAYTLDHVREAGQWWHRK